jgi:hypothetical protein
VKTGALLPVLTHLHTSLWGLFEKNFGYVTKSHPVSRMQALTSLNLSGNKLETLPGMTGQLQELKVRAPHTLRSRSRYESPFSAFARNAGRCRLVHDVTSASRSVC